ncbi:MAG: Ig-like domain-containing protein [Planctomycetota bacterium]
MPPAHSRSLRHALVLLGTLGLITGCTRLESHGAPAAFRLTHVRPSNAEGVFLNEELVFYFSEELEPTSVTSASLEIRSEPGVPARGRLEVGVDSIRFVPAPVLAADLSDGGFLPGTRYTVTLAGFPRPEGLRSARGGLLGQTWTWSFRTVDVAGQRGSLVFEDRSQDRVGILRIFPSAGAQVTAVASRDAIHLACDKPLDPSTVLPEAFRLVHIDKKERKSIEIRVQVLENHPESRQGPRPAAARYSGRPEDWERERRACVIEVLPEAALVEKGEYFLSVDPRPGDPRALLRDFSGNPVVTDASQGWGIRVREGTGDPSRSEIREEFDSRRLRSLAPLPGYDGTAAWGESGRVTVRFPAAAGNGGDGRIVLSEREERTDIQAVSLDLPERSTCRLPSTPGLVVLRCQGRMSIRGSLSREVPWDPVSEIEKDPTLAPWSIWSRTGPSKPAEPDPWVLSEWLEAARAGDWNWTVLIAGGDLSIEGELKTTNPVLLMAGGTIRVTGSVRGVEANVEPRNANGAEPAEEIRLGGVFLPQDSGASRQQVSPVPAITAFLLIDEPIGANPLVEPLRFVALSSPVPPAGDVLRWLPPKIGGGPIDEGWRVRYVPELASAPRRAEDLVPVDDPVLIEAPGPIQFLVELEVLPGGNWDPPWVDFVHLAWERPPQTPRSPFGGR